MVHCSSSSFSMAMAASYLSKVGADPSRLKLHPNGDGGHPMAPQQPRVCESGGGSAAPTRQQHAQAAAAAAARAAAARTRMSGTLVHARCDAAAPPRTRSSSLVVVVLPASSPRRSLRSAARHEHSPRRRWPFYRCAAAEALSAVHRRGPPAGSPSNSCRVLQRRSEEGPSCPCTAPAVHAHRAGRVRLYAHHAGRELATWIAHVNRAALRDGSRMLASPRGCGWSSRSLSVGDRRDNAADAA
jgi:hypothetical protein